MSFSSPKRSHSLIHHQKQQQQQQQQQEQRQHEHYINKLQSCIQPPQRSSSVRDHQSVRLTRSSSLSHLSRKVSIINCRKMHKLTLYKKKTPSRSKSLPQNPNNRLNEPLPPIPPFLFQDPKLQPVFIPPTRSSSLHKPRRLEKKQHDDEITKALLEWKHKSVFKVDVANMFPSTVELWKLNDKIFGSMEDLIDDESQIKKTTDSLWFEDEEFVPKKEIAAYLGKL